MVHFLILLYIFKILLAVASLPMAGWKGMNEMEFQGGISPFLWTKIPFFPHVNYKTNCECNPESQSNDSDGNTSAIEGAPSDSLCSSHFQQKHGIKFEFHCFLSKTGRILIMIIYSDKSYRANWKTNWERNPGSQGNDSDGKDSEIFPVFNKSIG